MIRNLETRVLTPKGNKMKLFFEASLSKEKNMKPYKQQKCQNNQELYYKEKHNIVNRKNKFKDMWENQYGFFLIKKNKLIKSPRGLKKKNVQSTNKSRSLDKLEFTFGNY